ncbi:MAG: hypothetical protein ACM3U2_08780 [Deltaproteobacteria bacterium]
MLLLTAAVFAAPEADTKQDDSENEAQKAAREIVESVELSALVGEKREKLELIKQPVLRFGDIPRANDRGSVWIWQRFGRPQAVMELYRGADSRSWVHVIHSLSPDALEGDFGARAPRWTPPGPGINWISFPDAPAPAERPAARARQIKELAQKFSAHEFWDPNNSRYELRLLIQPVHQYSEPDSGLLDGALFMLCHETNPEVALLIEAVSESGGPTFRYALARLGHAELHVALDEKEVWRQERVAATRPRDAYWLLFRGVTR